MTKIFATIIAFLLMLFPESGTLLIYQQQLVFPGEKAVAEEIIDAIKDKDVDVLVNMYAEISKSTGEVTKENIENFINGFKGNIIYGEYNGSGSSDKIAYGSGRSTRQIKMIIKTSEDTYNIFASWVKVDTENPENVGLLQLTMWDSYGYEIHEPTVQVPLKKSLTEAGFVNY